MIKDKLISKITKFEHHGVARNGAIKSGGAVEVGGGIRFIFGGCGLRGCHCSDGYSICMLQPLKNGVVKGETIHFKNHVDMVCYIKKKHLVSTIG